MATDLIDPLHGLSVLSLLSRTLKGAKGTAVSEQKDLGSILSNLHVVNGKGSDVYLEEAKMALSGSLVSQGDELPKNMESGVLGGGVAEEGRDRLQERRPGLGRKRARFSFKPNTSQPSLDLDESLNISQLQDPEDFFAACEKVENAKRELKKQRGETLTDATQYKPRSRRPGILGKKASYRHCYSDSDGGEDVELLPEKDQLISVYEDPIQDSAAEEPNKVDSLLDELLSVNAADLDGDGALSLLEEHLQIKSIKLDKFCMPDFESLRKSESKTLLNHQPLPRPRTPLSNVQNIVTRISQHERSAYLNAPSTQPKSPFSSLSMLKRRIALSESPGNPFKFHSTDMSPSHSSPLVMDKQNPSVHGDDAELNANDHTPSDNDQLKTPEKSLAALPEGRDSATSEGVSGKLVNENLHQSLEPMVGSVTRSVKDTGLQQNGSGQGLVEDKDLQQENVASEDPDLICQDSTAENLNSSERRLDDSEPSPVKDHQMDQQSDVDDILTDRNNKANQEPPEAASNKPEKEKGTKVTKRKIEEVSRRKSLAGAGTMWKSGVRRSTRVRMRPLEYWKGERFLYGRVHESLLTVIGCKYESPSSANGKPKLKVKSFVSDNFKELVEKAALH